MFEGKRSEVVVVGGGLAGLTVALLLARSGREVIVVERGGEVGGRARTDILEGFFLNRGPHALYREGEGAAILRELGIHYRGAVPSRVGQLALYRGALHRLPSGTASLLTTGLMGGGAKLEAARILRGLPRLEAGRLHDMSLEAWLASEVRQGDTRAVIEAFVRLFTYTNAPDRLSAGAAVAQFQRALAGNVVYIDGGWASLVNELCEALQDAGATILTGSPALYVRRESEGWHVELARASLHAPAVVLATSPSVAARLVDGAEGDVLRVWAVGATPVRAACLDVALSRLPRPGRQFVLGIDRPLYLSVHSTSARLAPGGGAVIHVAKYLHPEGSSSAEEDEAELEGLLDMVQAGWRSVVVERRYLPRMVVMNALVDVAHGGQPGRPGVQVPGAPGLFVAGDWVGQEGMLVDASLASARRVAEMAQREARPVSGVARQEMERV